MEILKRNNRGDASFGSTWCHQQDEYWSKLEEGLDSQETKESYIGAADSFSDHAVSGNVIKWSSLDQMYKEGKKDIKELKRQIKEKEEAFKNKKWYIELNITK